MFKLIGNKQDGVMRFGYILITSVPLATFLA